MVKQKLLDTARDTMRRKHLSYRTEQASCPGILHVLVSNGFFSRKEESYPSMMMPDGRSGESET